MFRNILVPLDGSLRAERVLPIAARIARASQGKVILLRVVYAFPLEKQATSTSSLLFQQALQHDVDEAHKYLTAVASSRQLDDIDKETVVLQGPFLETIQAAAKTYGADLLVICEQPMPSGTHQHRDLLTSHLLKRLSIPLFLLPGQGPVICCESGHFLTFEVAFRGLQPQSFLIQPAVALMTALAEKDQCHLRFAPVIGIPSHRDRLPTGYAQDASYRQPSRLSSNTATAVKEEQRVSRTGRAEHESQNIIYIVSASTLDTAADALLTMRDFPLLFVPSPIGEGLEPTIA